MKKFSDFIIEEKSFEVLFEEIEMNSIVSKNLLKGFSAWRKENPSSTTVKSDIKRFLVEHNKDASWIEEILSSLSKQELDAIYKQVSDR